MNPLLIRFAIRLAIPLASVLSLWAVGKPLPQALAEADSEIAVVASIATCVAPALSDEIALARNEIEEGAAELRRAAAHMRWLVTLPAASSKRCGSPACAG